MEGIDGGYVVVERKTGRAALQRIAAVLGMSQHATNQASLEPSRHTLSLSVDNGSCKVRCLDGHQLWLKVSSAGVGSVDLPLGVWRKARVVLTTTPKPAPMTAFERRCAAAVDLVKDAYLKLIASEPFKTQCSDRNQIHLNPVLWDFKVSLVSSFIKLLVDECGEGIVPLSHVFEQRFALGFHGTPAGNTDDILKNGFDPSKNRCGKAGAFFTGCIGIAYAHGSSRNRSNNARCYGGPASSSDVLIVALVRGHERHGTSSACDKLRRISAQEVALPETHALPLASIRCGT